MWVGRLCSIMYTVVTAILSSSSTCARTSPPNHTAINSTTWRHTRRRLCRYVVRKTGHQRGREKDEERDEGRLHTANKTCNWADALDQPLISRAMSLNTLPATKLPLNSFELRNLEMTITHCRSWHRRSQGVHWVHVHPQVEKKLA